MKKLRIGFTGISGLIGSNISKYLEDTYNVEIANLSCRLPFEGTYGQTWLSELNECDILFHFGAIKDSLAIRLEGFFKASLSFNRSRLVQNVNEIGTAQIFDLFLRSKSRTFVFASSSQLYKDCSKNGEVFCEESILSSCLSNYALSKLNAEEYINSRKLAKGKTVLILRIAPIYGYNCLSGNLGKIIKYKRFFRFIPRAFLSSRQSLCSISTLKIVSGSIIKGSIPSGTYNICDDSTISISEIIDLWTLKNLRRPSVKDRKFDVLQFKRAMVLNNNKVKNAAGIDRLPCVLKEMSLLFLSHEEL
jgi:nucleoside-diphosphate-sugar epimerase